MRKGQRLYTKEDIIHPISFFPVESQLIQAPIYGEIFVDITEKMVPDILPYYMISNYGRMWHKYKCTFLSTNLDSKGYPFKPLQTTHGPVMVRIHRLVGYAFLYQPGCENLQINHKDGNKTNNHYWNLEWVTPSENSIHAVNSGLRNYNNRKYTNKEVVNVCELLEEGKLTIPQIAIELNLPEHFVSSIQRKEAHVEISNNYNFKLRKIGSNFDQDQVRKLCEWISTHEKNDKENNDMYITRALNEALEITEVNHKLIKSVKKILYKETYTYISNEYF